MTMKNEGTEKVYRCREKQSFKEVIICHHDKVPAKISGKHVLKLEVCKKAVQTLKTVPKGLEGNDGSITIDPIEVKVTDIAKNDLKFKKRLIAQVQRHPILYDTKHKNFTNMPKKEETWLKITTALTAEVNVCKNTWFDLRYEYQRYARRLRKFFNSGNKNNKRRPVMAMEIEMIFLWRFVANKTLYPLPPEMESNENNENVAIAETTQHAAEEDDVVMLENDPVVVIDLDDYEDSSTLQNNSILLITHEVYRLVNLIKIYPELYNSTHRYYNDFKRKGIIWNAIANELGDKATKIMKCWLHIQTRYEWELNHLQDSSNANETKLQKLLKFLSSHTNCNPNTVYKHAFYLKKNWHAPMEHFESIARLLAVMRRMPQIVTLTDDLLHDEIKNDKFFQLWHDVAKMRGTTMGICETTWLLLRSFYWELMSMRKHSYRLQDKWYFESIITELYALAEPAKTESPSITVPSSETHIAVNVDEDEILFSKIEKKQDQSLKSTISSYPNVLVNEQVKVPRILSVKSLASPRIHMIKTYSSTGFKITPTTSPIVPADAAFNASKPPSLSLKSSPSSSPTFPIAVIGKDGPNQRLSGTELNHCITQLRRAVVSVDPDLHPKEYEVMNGTLKVTCSSQANFDWIRTVVSRIPTKFKGSSKFVVLSEIDNAPRKAICWISDSDVTTAEVLSYWGAQNPGIDTRSWKVLSHSKSKNQENKDGTSLVVLMDQASVDVLESRCNNRLNLFLGAVTFQIIPK